MTDIQLLAECILSEQVPAEEVPALCEKNPGLAELLHV